WTKVMVIYEKRASAALFFTFRLFYQDFLGCFTGIRHDLNKIDTRGKVSQRYHIDGSPYLQVEDLASGEIDHPDPLGIGRCPYIQRGMTDHRVGINAHATAADGTLHYTDG